MSDDVRWITARIAEARQRRGSVTDAVSARMERLLKGQLRNQRIPSGELAKLARKLIADMVPAPPKAETKQ